MPLFGNKFYTSPAPPHTRGGVGDLLYPGHTHCTDPQRRGMNALTVNALYEANRGYAVCTVRYLYIFREKHPKMYLSLTTRHVRPLFAFNGAFTLACRTIFGFVGEVVVLVLQASPTVQLSPPCAKNYTSALIALFIPRRWGSVPYVRPTWQIPHAHPACAASGLAVAYH